MTPTAELVRPFIQGCLTCASGLKMLCALLHNLVNTSCLCSASTSKLPVLQLALTHWVEESAAHLPGCSDSNGEDVTILSACQQARLLAGVCCITLPVGFSWHSIQPFKG